MKKLMIFICISFIFYKLNGQPVTVNWENELNEYKVIAKGLFNEAQKQYNLIKDLGDTISIKNYFSEKDSTHYFVSYTVDTNSLLHMNLIEDNTNRYNAKPPKSIHLVFRPNGLPYSLTLLKGGVEYYGSFFSKHDGFPVQIHKRMKKEDGGNYLILRFQNKKGKLLSIFSYTNSKDLISNGLSVLLSFGNNRKIVWLKYFDKGVLLYGLNYYQSGAKYEETTIDSNNHNKVTTYLYSKAHKVLIIYYYDYSFKNPFLHYIRFHRGRIIEEKIADKSLKDIDSGIIIHYDRKHNIKTIKNY